ncbi:CDP-alcohol phosphatidyltransferase family protein, partial [Hansschlegelia beijingensis]
MTDATRPASAPTALLVGASEVRIWGMSAAERLRRQLKRVGVTDVREAAEAPAGGRALLFRLDHAYEQRLVEALA